MLNQIEKQVEIKAPVSRVWRALTDSAEFGAWFGVKLETPFIAGQASLGQITYPGMEHLKFEIQVLNIEPEGLFSFTWHPYPIEPNVDYSAETPTLVEFTLEPITIGTLVKVTESGFENIPPGRALEAFRMNEHGWTQQMKNIEKYVAANP
jgi:uncharacterized protein YndB with AHSA1/START domain